MNPSEPTSDLSITCLLGSCHCGAVSYELPLPPDVDLSGPNASDLYKNIMVGPSKQSTARGDRPNRNKWRATHCHCRACRRTVGTLMMDWVNIPVKDAIITRNGPTGKYRASDHASREFCQTCGTSLFFLDDEEPGLVVVSVASITTPDVFEFIQFDGHIWLGDTVGFVLDAEGKGGGLAGIMRDGLPRTVQGRSSSLFDSETTASNEEELKRSPS